jgi:hypothetical protein
LFASSLYLILELDALVRPKKYDSERIKQYEDFLILNKCLLRLLERVV